MIGLSSLTTLRKKAQSGFTMIELLIVIAILGILATAVLSAINPVEQINRGRDTGTRSDAEQLISAIDRYNAFKGFFPWVADASVTTLKLEDPNNIGSPVQVDIAGPLVTVDDGAGGTVACHFLNRVSSADALSGSACPSPEGTQELKSTFVSRITSAKSRPLFLFNRGQQGDSTYACFIPQSQAFKTEAQARCGTAGAGLPSDLIGVKDFLCDDTANAGTGEYYICLP